MANDVDAVIAALRIVLRDAEMHPGQLWWKTEVVNRWIGQLPGAWWGRWRRLKLRGDGGGHVVRTALIGHASATLAYLEMHQEVIETERRWWPLGKLAQHRDGCTKEPSGAEKSREVALSEPAAAKPKWLN